MLYIAVCAFAVRLPAFEAQPAAGPDNRKPKEVKPPHQAVDQGFRMSLLTGISGEILPARYSYSTRINMPVNQQLNYAGTQTAQGGAFLVGVQVAPPNALRRFTVGISFGFGGLASWLKTPVPDGVSIPFSPDNLRAAIQRGYAYRTGWHPSISPYIEHELGDFFGNRCRIGYQYLRQSGQYRGTFIPGYGGPEVAAYSVDLKRSAHMIRFSINNLNELGDARGSGPTRLRYGLIQQAGLLVGTNQTVTVFFGIGPFWGF